MENNSKGKFKLWIVMLGLGISVIVGGMLIILLSINKQTLDSRSNASPFSPPIARLDRIQLFNGYFPEEPHYREILFPEGRMKRLNGGMIQVRTNNPNTGVSWSTPGWQKAIVYKVNGVEKERFIVDEFSGSSSTQYASLDPAQPIANEARVGDTISIFINLRKVVDGIVYTCKYNSTMVQNQLGHPESQTLVPGGICQNLGVKTIRVTQ